MLLNRVFQGKILPMETTETIGIDSYVFLVLKKTMVFSEFEIFLKKSYGFEIPNFTLI